MTIAIISDIHIGDKSSRILDENGNFNPNSVAYKKLKDGIRDFTNKKPLEFLVLAGDIMDFTINSVSDSINRSRRFFQCISDDRLARRIVYIPGNHDKQVWDGLQWDTSIIGNLSLNHPAKPFPFIQTAIIDQCRSILLEGVKPLRKGKYENIFLKGLFERPGGNPDIILAYPNLYIKRDHETVIVTHGHMFETRWIILSTLLRGVCGISAKPGLKELEEWNIPVTAMFATALGSGGEVSELFYRIEREAYEKKTDKLKMTLDKAVPRFKKELNLPWYKNILIPSWIIKKIIMSIAAKVEDPREYRDYLEDGNNLRHFRYFFKVSMEEADRYNLPDVKKIFFGHTHHPYRCGKPYLSQHFPEIEFYNMGGWLKESSAEVFLIDNRRFESFSV